MSSGRGRSPCDTGPHELRLDVIVLARWPLPRDGTMELVQRVGEQIVHSDDIVVPWNREPGDVPGSPEDGNTKPATCLTSRQRQLLRTRTPCGATAARGRQCRR
jgi:hypothetical protein